MNTTVGNQCQFTLLHEYRFHELSTLSHMRVPIYIACFKAVYAFTKCSLHLIREYSFQDNFSLGRRNLVLLLSHLERFDLSKF